MTNSRATRSRAIAVAATFLVGALGSGGVRGQVVPPDGANLRLNETTEGPQVDPATAVVDVQGNFVAAWSSTLGPGDTFPDVVFASSAFDEQGLTGCRGDGMGSFLDCFDLDLDIESYGVALGDVDLDGNLDAVFANGGESGGERNLVCRGDGGGGFTTCQQADPSSSEESFGVALGDLNGDGFLDAVFANGQPSGDSNPPAPSRACLNNGSGGFPSSLCSNLVSGLFDRNSRGVALGDVDGDNDLDVVLANGCTEHLLIGCDPTPPLVCENEGAGEFGLGCGDLQAFLDLESHAVALANLNEDGDLDAIFANQNGNAVFCKGPLRGFPGPTCTTLPGGGNSGVVLGDLDDDGDLDAVFASTILSARDELCENLGGHPNPLWSCDVIPGVLSASFGVALGDLDGDTHPDAVFAVDGARDKVCLNDGAGGFLDCVVLSTVEDNDSRAVALGQLDPARTAVFGRRFDGAGSPLGPDFVVGVASGHPVPVLAKVQRLPAVSSDLSGRFVVAWQAVWSSTSFIVVQRFDSSGPLGDPILVAARGPEGVVEQASVAMDATGGFVVVWQQSTSPGAGIDVRARRFDADGGTLGGELLLAGGMDREARPAVGRDLDSGAFLVAWRSPGPFVANDAPGIVARLYDADGQPAGDPFSVEQNTSGVQERPAVAADFEGNFVVAWEGDGLGSREISARWFDSTASSLGGEFQVNTTSAGDQSRPTVAVVDLAGDLVVSWESEEPGLHREIRARWFAYNSDQQGITQVDDFGVSTSSPGHSASPTLSGDLSGNFVVAWQGPGSTDPEGIHAQRYVAPVKLQINDLSLLEGDPSSAGGAPESLAVFAVEASKPHPLGASITVEFQTGDGTATFLEDYQFTSDTLTFAGGETVRSFSIPVVADAIFEEDETFVVALSDATHAVISRPEGLGTIENDDLPGSIAIDDVSRVEGDSGSQSFVFTVSLAPVQQADAIVSFATVDGTATAGSDYEATSGVITIPAGVTTGFVSVQVFGDTVIEEDEVFYLDLSDPANSLIGDGRGVGTIESDENCLQPPSIATTSAQFPVSGGSGTVSILDPLGCGWTALSQDPWITISSGQSGSGDGTVEFQVAANPELTPRSGEMAIAGESFSVSQDGTLCTFTVTPASAHFLSAGGPGSATVTASDPICQWTAQSNDPWITLVNVSSGTGDGSLTFEVAPNAPPGAARQGSLTIAARSISVTQDGVFFDDFDDDVMDPGWQYEEPQLWSEEGSFLRAEASGPGVIAVAIARPAFVGCNQCTIESGMKVNTFSTGKVILYGWYSSVDDHVSLTLSEFADTWTLTERIGGVDVQTLESDALEIEVGRSYDVQLEFDGTDIRLAVDGLPLLSMPATSSPDGTVGFQVGNADASFDDIAVSTVTGPLPLFTDGFESGALSAWSDVVP